MKRRIPPSQKKQQKAAQKEAKDQEEVEKRVGGSVCKFGKKRVKAKVVYPSSFDSV